MTPGRQTQAERNEDWVKELLAKTEAGSKMNFSFSIFLFVASVIAGLGLVANSPELLIASMIISPLMGSIMAITLGATFKLWRLFFKGLKITFASLTICFVVGICLGTLVSAFQIMATGTVQPTPAMLSRGNAYGLVEGLTAAVMSSVAAGAVAVGKDKYKLVGVGVGISLALLPPVVNCGMLTAYGISRRMLKVAAPAVDVFKAAGVSLSVAIINILCIVFIILLFYRYKVGKSSLCCKKSSRTNTPCSTQEVSEEDCMPIMEKRLKELNSELAETAPDRFDDVEKGNI